MPTNLQGVPFRGTGDAILNLHTPAGLSQARQREFVDLTAQLNQERLRITGDPEIATRISAYEMAFRMQTSAPELMDLAQEPAHVLASYGAEPGQNSFANNCLLARRLVERGVRFVQLYHTDWDDHGGPNENLGEPLERRCRQIDQSCAALVQDLKSRGMLDETIVIWGGEFGRTPMGEIREGIPGATITSKRLPCGSPGAASNLGTSKGPPTIWAITPSTGRSTYTICTPRC